MAMPEGWTNEDFLSWVSRGGDPSSLAGPVTGGTLTASTAPTDLNAVRQQISGFTSEDQLNNFLRTTSLSPDQLAQAFPEYSVSDITNRIAASRVSAPLTGVDGQGQVGTPQTGAPQFTDKQLQDIALYFDTYASDPGKVLNAMKEYGVDAGTLSRAVQQYGRGSNDPGSVQDYVARYGTMIYGDPTFGGNTSQRRDIYSQQRSEAQQREQQRVALLTQAGFLDSSGKPTPAALRQPTQPQQPTPMQRPGATYGNVTEGMFGGMYGMNQYGMNPYQMGGFGGYGMGGGYPGMGGYGMGGYPGLFGGQYGGMGGYGGYTPFSSLLMPYGQRGFGNYGYGPMMPSYGGYGGYGGMGGYGGYSPYQGLFSQLARPQFGGYGGYSGVTGGSVESFGPGFGQPMKPIGSGGDQPVPAGFGNYNNFGPDFGQPLY